MKTVLITGASTGIGFETAKYFLANNWNVVATMRNPQKSKLQAANNLHVVALDVTDIKSIESAIDIAIAKFGKIDVLVNNAGYALAGAFEAMSNKDLRKQYDTNFFGVLNVTKAILPHFRANKNGTVINITSMGGLITFPTWSAYHGTKWAVEGFMESLHFELRPFNIKIKNVEPGAIQTEFENSMAMASNETYKHYLEVVSKNMMAAYTNAPHGDAVAKVVFKAANDNNFKLRYPVSMQSKMLLFLRFILPENWFYASMRMALEKGL
jgi:NADP-dependent 3-hydroxy acid dehydrogenase YdfG